MYILYITYFILYYIYILCHATVLFEGKVMPEAEGLPMDPPGLQHLPPLSPPNRMPARLHDVPPLPPIADRVNGGRASFLNQDLKTRQEQGVASPLGDPVRIRGEDFPEATFADAAAAGHQRLRTDGAVEEGPSVTDPEGQAHLFGGGEGEG